MKKEVCLSVLTSLMITAGSSQAAHFDAFVTGGAVMPRVVNSPSVWFYPDLLNQYTTIKKTLTGSAWGGGVALGMNASPQRPIDATLGVSGYSVDFRHVTGIKNPFANQGNFDPLFYSFQAKSQLIMAEGRLFYTGSSWQPYLLAGVGGAYNTFSRYRETATGTAVEGQLYTNASQHDVAFEAGFGLKHALFQDTLGVRYALSLDYRYINAGAAHLGPFIGQITEDRLRVKHLETDALLLTLSASV